MQVEAFQEAFNGLDIDLRGSAEAQAELLLRCDELQDALWEVCDQRMNDNEAQLRSLKYVILGHHAMQQCHNSYQSCTVSTKCNQCNAVSGCPFPHAWQPVGATTSCSSCVTNCD